MPSLQEILAAKQQQKTTPQGSPLEIKAISSQTSSSISSLPSGNIESDVVQDFSANTVYQDAVYTVEDIVPRIRNLINIPDVSLEGEMTALKKSLMDNPSAVELMLPSDIGAMVAALRRITGEHLLTAEMKKQNKKDKKLDIKKLSAEDIAALEDF